MAKLNRILLFITLGVVIQNTLLMVSAGTKPRVRYGKRFKEDAGK